MDATATGRVDEVARNYVEMFVSACRITFNSLKQSSDKNDVKAAEVLGVSYGFTPSTNGSQGLTCQNGGKLSSYGGCECTEGYTGVDCSVGIQDVKKVEPTEEERKAVLGDYGITSVQSASSINQASILLSVLVGIVLLNVNH